MAQRRGGARAAGTSTAHVQIDDAVAEALEGDVAAVLGNLRTNARFDQFLDGRNGFGIFRIEVITGLSIHVRAIDDRRTRQIMLHDRTQDRWANVLPFGSPLGNRDEIGP